MAPTDARGRDRCDEDAGRLVPVIDRNRCEAKEDCLRVCPWNVFEIGVLSREERKQLSWIGMLKAFGHRHRQAYAVRAADCHACGLCVEACPEKAIRLSSPSRAPGGA